jgi:hypothetical protein
MTNNKQQNTNDVTRRRTAYRALDIDKTEERIGATVASVVVAFAAAEAA